MVVAAVQVVHIHYPFGSLRLVVDDQVCHLYHEGGTESLLTVDYILIYSQPLIESRLVTVHWLSTELTAKHTH